MTPPPVHAELSELLARQRWLRALAGSMAKAQDADDLAQDACVLALERPPAGGSAKAWLRAVVKNLWSQQHRAERRRSTREQRFEETRPAAAEATDQLVERAAAQRAIVDAVLALPSALREVVLLRFFEELPPRTIAAHLELPVATVHSRLQRALQRLRGDLIARQPAGVGRAPWAILLLPSLSTATVITMNVKLLVAAAVLVGGSLFWFTREGGASASTAGGAAPSPSTPVASVERPVGPPGVGVERVAATPDSPAIVASARRSCAGRAVDAEGRPVPQLELKVGELQVRTAVDGAFVAEVTARGELQVHAADAAWQTVLQGVVRPGEAPPPVLVVVAPTVRLGGHVRAADTGAPLAADLRVVWPGDLRSRLSEIGDRAEESRLRGASGPDGAFSLVAGAVRGAELLVVADGFRPHRLAIPRQHAAAIDVALERLAAAPGTLLGQVVDAAGRPVSGARVGLGKALARSDELGNFAIDDDGSAATLRAIAAGHRRGELQRERGFGAFVVLQLGAEPLTIRGRVVDERGAPVAGVDVWPVDLSVLCDSREPIAMEGVASGCMTMGELRERFERGEFAGRDPREVIASTPTVHWPWVRTGADGAFELRGLEPRAYRLRVLDRESLQMNEVADVAAGRDDVVLTLDRSDLFAEMRGLVRSRAGAPVAGCEVRVQLDAQSLRGNTMHAQAVTQATTDEHGAFVLRDVPRRHAYLRLDGDYIVPVEPGRGLDGGLAALCGGDPLGLRVEVALRMHVQVELLDATRADSLEVLDDAGEKVAITVFVGRGRRDSDTLQFADGRSPVFVVPDSARTLLLKKGDAEVGREVLQLQAGAVNTLRL